MYSDIVVGLADMCKYTIISVLKMNEPFKNNAGL
jgi:hypothetical protein